MDERIQRLRKAAAQGDIDAQKQLIWLERKYRPEWLRRPEWADDVDFPPSDYDIETGWKLYPIDKERQLATAWTEYEDPYYYDYGDYIDEILAFRNADPIEEYEDMLRALEDLEDLDSEGYGENLRDIEDREMR